MNDGILTSTLYWAVLIFFAAAAVRLRVPAMGLAVLLYCIGGTAVSIVQAALAAARFYGFAAQVPIERQAYAVATWMIVITLYVVVIVFTDGWTHGDSRSSGVWAQAVFLIVLWSVVGSAVSVMQLGIIFKLEHAQVMFQRWRRIITHRPGPALVAGGGTYFIIAALFAVLLSLRNSSSATSTLLSTGSIMLLLLVGQYTIAYLMLEVVALTMKVYLEDVVSTA